jgi:hypothetical protein
MLSLRSAAALALVPLFALAFPACSGESDPSKPPPDAGIPAREPGVRAPLTAPCDAMDPQRCLLPWPSSTFTSADPSTPTGLRVHVDLASLAAPDDPASINRADGFSRVTPLVAGFAATVGPVPTGSSVGGPVRLLLAQPDHPRYGEAVPLRVVIEPGEADDGSPESFVFAYPLRPLEPNADYLALVLDDLPVTSGAALAPSRAASVALGLAPPASGEESRLFAYHAPARALVGQADVDPRRVLRVWDFTTRSSGDPTRRLVAMREAALRAVAKAEITVVIDKVDLPAAPPIAAIVEGHLGGLPAFVASTPGAGLSLDAAGLPVPSGSREAPFRIVLPAGQGTYPFLMFGHGTGGEFTDDILDAEVASLGGAKVGIELHGWTKADVLDTFVGFLRMFEGTHHAVGLLMQSLADGAAISAALGGALGDALSASTLGGSPNPAAGRRPDPSRTLWVGGSLGGTMSLVAVGVDPALRHGVLNVPGAAWTHFVPGSKIFEPIRGLLHNPYGDLNALLAVAMSQGNWDEIDGAVWSEALAQKSSAFLIQESIGDPVLPNPGSAMVAVVTGAAQVGTVLSPIEGVPEAGPIEGKSGITQYRVADTDPFAIHGFAARDTPAGAAAREQMAAFLGSVWAGKPAISVPAGCPKGSCDFSGP